MEGLEEKWKQLNLSAEEGNKIVINENLVQEKLRMEKNSLLAKLIQTESSTKKSFVLRCPRYGKRIDPSQFRSYVVFNFENEMDKQRVFGRRPWLFDSALLSPQPFDGITPTSKMDFSMESFWVQLHNLPLGCMHEDIGRQVGDTIIVVKACDVREDGSGWGKVLRMYIELDLCKPLPRGRTLNILGEKIWVPLSL